MTETPIPDDMTADSSPPVITAEVTVESGAKFALTNSNAIFRNGYQLVIPHTGVPFLQELMEALTSEPFVTGIIQNYLEASEVVDVDDDVAVAEALGVGAFCGARSEDLGTTCNDRLGHEGAHTYTEANGGVTAWHDHEEPTENATCDAIHGATGAGCERPHGHEGAHSSWQGAPADWGGGEDIVWEDVTIAPTPEVPVDTSIDGFIVQRYGDGESANVWHPRMNKRLGFGSRESAESTWGDGLNDWYDRLCANIYLEWYDTYFPGQEEWRKWVAGTALISDQGTRALIVPSADGLALINNEGNIFAVEAGNADIFSHWTVSR